MSGSAVTTDLIIRESDKLRIRGDQSSKRSVLERLEFSEKQCELQPAAPWLRESPMLCHFVKPDNNSYFAPLRQVVWGHFQLSRKPLSPSEIYK